MAMAIESLLLMKRVKSSMEIKLCSSLVKMHKNHELNNDMIVSTVMSNLGFIKPWKMKAFNPIKQSWRSLCCRRNEKSNYNLGGEQSGHIVLMDYNTTGDGLLTGVQLASVIKMSGKSLSELAAQMKNIHNLSLMLE